MNEGVFLIGFFLFFFVAWVGSGGPNKPISFAGPYITPVTTVGTTQTGYGTLPTGSQSISAARGNLTNIQQSLATLNKKVQNQKIFGAASPHQGEVTISWGNRLGGTDPKQEYIQLRASSNAPQNLDITGWKLIAVSNDATAVIPQGQELYSNVSAATSDVILHPNDVAVITTGESPINRSFRENECMGYVTNGEPFSPSLSQSCPSPIDDFNAMYSGNPYKDQCYQTIQNLYGCQVPGSNSHLSTTCETFIASHLNYTGCVDNHRTDQYFWGNTWHIFLNRKPIEGHQNDTRYYGTLWKPSHDAIKLVDQNGLTVDLYEY